MYKLIIVEDDWQIRNGLNRFFPWNEIGFEVVGCFENGQTALAFLKETPDVDVVLTDIKMPVMDGLALAQALVDRGYPAKIVLISAYRNFDYAKQAMTYGIKNYIVKSTRYDELVEVFRKIVEELKADKRSVDAAYARPARREKPATIDQILHYIDSGIKSATLQTVAGHFGLNAVYFSRYFKEKVGVNFIDYIIRKKMEIAAAQLISSRYSILQISEMVGYSNEKNFSRAFKQYYGMSPSSYRRYLTAATGETDENHSF